MVARKSKAKAPAKRKVATARPALLFERVSDSELRMNGFNPKYILVPLKDETKEGPYRVYEDPNGECGHCGGKALSWCVISLETAVAVTRDATGPEAEESMWSTADRLNIAWLYGREAGRGGSDG